MSKTQFLPRGVLAALALVGACGADMAAEQPVTDAETLATLGVTLLTALVARWPAEGPGRRVLRWAGRLLAAGLVACGVILTSDGVLDV